MSLLTALHNAVTKVTDAHPIAVVRILIGVAAIITSVETWFIARRVLAPSVIELPYVAWYPRLPLAALPSYITLWCIAAVLVTLGVLTRLASIMLLALLCYILLLDQRLYSNHLYLLSVVVLLLALADSGASWSIDARWSGTRSSIAAWPVLLLKLQVSIVYGFAALAKINPVYLSGAVLSQGFDRAVIQRVPTTWLPITLSTLAVISIAAELFLAVALWSVRWRWLALLCGIGLHSFIILAGAHTLFSQLQFANFALIMMAPYILFFWSASDCSTSKSPPTPSPPTYRNHD